MREKSIFNHVLLLLVAVIILPMILVYSIVSSVLTETLHENFWIEKPVDQHQRAFHSQG